MRLDADYLYSNFENRESGNRETGALPGVRGDLALELGSSLVVAAGGEYWDGHVNFAGTSLTGSNLQILNSTYLRDIYARVEVPMGSLQLTAGIGQRERLDNFVGNYRRRETFNYFPVTATYTQQFFYIRAEVDVWKSGNVQAYMSDVSAAEHNVTLDFGSGLGYGAEIGALLATSGHFYNRIFIGYHHWDVGQTNAASDGVRSVQIPSAGTTVIQAGIGVSF
jgi:hypothetical protein